MKWRSQFVASAPVVSALTAAVLLAHASSVSAVTLQYFLDTSVAGQFKVFAQTKGGTGDHGGLASFGIELLGATTIQNMAPFTSFANGPNGQGPAGFSESRSAPNEGLVTGAQDVITPTPNLIYGFARESSSFAQENITPLAPPNVLSWDAKLLLAQGTHNGLIRIDYRSENYFANVFQAEANPAVVPERSRGFAYRFATRTSPPSTWETPMQPSSISHSSRPGIFR
jgi:hypothetical protein